MTGMLIAGERTEGAASEGIAVVDPATEETLESVPRGTAQDVDSAVQAADKAFAEWSRTDAEDRAILLRKAIALIERDRKDLVNSLVHEQGKPVTEAGGEVHHLLHGLNYYADLATKVRGSYQALPSALSKAYGMVLRRPMGVVAAIVPNNFPLTLFGTKLAPALMAGNTIVGKAAATTPLTTLKIAALLQEAGFPPGVINVITGKGSEVGDALVTHDKAAARGIAIGRFWSCGQMCLGGKRIYVFDEVYDELLEQITRNVGKYEPGLGWEKAEKPAIRVGPLHTS